MKIVVTGATGFVGRPLVRRLLDAGHEVTAWTRNPESARRLLPALCALERWDASGSVDPEQLRGVDVIVHLAGESVAGGRWTAERKRKIRDSRIATTRAIVDALATLPAGDRPRALVSSSAIGFYGDRGDEALTESSLPGDGFLADVCRAWEDEVKRAEAHGLRTVMVRTGVVLGRDGGALQAMLPPFRLGAGGRVGSGKQWMSWIHLDDLVALYQRAIEDPNVGGPVNGVAPHPVTNADFTAELGRALGRPTLVPVPAFGLKLALGEMAQILLASQRVLPERALSFGFAFRWPELGPALDDLVAEPVHELYFEQWVPRPPDEVFPFFSDARNLEKLTPDFLKFQVLAVNPEPVRAGTVIDYKLSLHGLPMKWQSVIESWEPGRGFVDRQVSGPYRSWVHTHEFVPARGGTILRDRVRYAVPLGVVGDVVAGGFVKRDVVKIFAFRHQVIEGMYGAATPPAGDDRRGRAA